MTTAINNTQITTNNLQAQQGFTHNIRNFSFLQQPHGDSTWHYRDHNWGAETKQVDLCDLKIGDI